MPQKTSSSKGNANSLDNDQTLDFEPFSFRTRKDGSVELHRGGRLVVTLGTKEATKFLSKVDRLDEPAAQLLMASVTGQYKFGNERQAAHTRRAKNQR